MMRRTMFLLVVVPAVPACGDSTSNDDAGATDGTSSGTDSPSTSAAGPTTTGNGTSDSSTTTQSGGGSTTTDASSTGSDGGSTGDTDTGVTRACDSQDSYALSFSTYFGGAEDWEHVRSVAIDAEGSVYITGGTSSDDYPTTAGAYDETFNGVADIFVTKFSVDGQLLWSTLIGGPGHDRAYTVRVDDAGYVYLSGRAGMGFPVTNGAFQTQFHGYDTGAAYGVQNGFLAKIEPDGSDLVWASYVGVSGLVRTMDIDDQGDLYASLAIDPGGSGTDPAWFAEAFINAHQPTPAGGGENGVVKVATDGTEVLWATWLGGSGDERPRSTVRVDSQHRPYVLVPTASSDLTATAGAWSSTYAGNEDLFLARFSDDGSTLEMGTYIGGSQLDEIETHGLALADDGVYVGFYTQSADLETTAGAFQETFGGGNLDIAIARLDENGGLVASTFLGGSGGEAADGFAVTPQGDVLVAGESDSADFPVTADAFQSALAGQLDGMVSRLSPDLSTLVYGTYMGGANRDNMRAGAFDSDCSFVVAGAADGPGFPVHNAIQPDFAGGGANFGNGDNIIARFASTP